MNNIEDKITVDEARKLICSGLHVCFSNETSFVKLLQLIGHQPTYNANNLILLSQQNDSITSLGGFGAWKKMHRHVNMGEKSFKILKPVVKKNDEGKDCLDYETVSMFDISQTSPNYDSINDTSMLPSVDANIMMNAFRASTGCSIEYSNEIKDKAVFDKKNNRILYFSNDKKDIMICCLKEIVETFVEPTIYIGEDDERKATPEYQFLCNCVFVALGFRYSINVSQRLALFTLWNSTANDKQRIDMISKIRKCVFAIASFIEKTDGLLDFDRIAMLNLVLKTQDYERTLDYIEAVKDNTTEPELSDELYDLSSFIYDLAADETRTKYLQLFNDRINYRITANPPYHFVE